jgi:tRNA (guanine-N7-)-methyltransferase
LKIYQQVIASNSLIRFKTDDDGLFEYTCELFAQLGIEPEFIDRDVHQSNHVEPYIKNIRTHYENLFSAKGRKIKYMEFRLPHQLLEPSKA